MEDTSTFLVDIKNKMTTLANSRKSPANNKRSRKQADTAINAQDMQPQGDPANRDPLNLELHCNAEDAFEDSTSEDIAPPRMKSQIGAVINKTKPEKTNHQNKREPTKEEVEQDRMAAAMKSANDNLDNYFKRQTETAHATTTAETSVEEMEQDIELDPFSPGTGTYGKLQPLRQPTGLGPRTVPRFGPEHNRHTLINAVKLTYVQLNPLLNIPGQHVTKFYRIQPPLPLPHVLNKVRDDDDPILQEAYTQYLTKLLSSSNRAPYIIRREGVLKNSTIFGSIAWEGQKTREVGSSEARIDPDSVLVRRAFVGSWDETPTVTLTATYYYTGEYKMMPCPPNVDPNIAVKDQIEQLLSYQDNMADIPHCNVLNFLNGDPPIVARVHRPREKSDDWDYATQPLADGLKPQLPSRHDRERSDREKDRKHREIVDRRRHH